MIITDKYIYGTLRECVDELWKRIDFVKMKFPIFSFAAVVSDDITDPDQFAWDAEAWFRCVDVTKMFQGDSYTGFSLIFGYYGGTVTECMELFMESSDDEKSLKETFMQRIGNSTDLYGYGILAPDDYTVFEVDTVEV